MAILEILFLFLIPFYTIKTLKNNIKDIKKLLIASISTIFPIVTFLIFVFVVIILGSINTDIILEKRIIVYIIWILNLIVTCYFILSTKIENSKKGILIIINAIMVVFLILGFPWLFYF